MFNPLDFIKKLFAKKSAPLDPARVDKLDLQNWGMGEIPKELLEVAYCPQCFGPVKESGGHGAWCLDPACKWGWETEMDGSPLKPPVDRLMGLPTTGEPPTHKILERRPGDPLLRPGDKGWAPHGDEDFNARNLEQVRPDQWGTQSGEIVVDAPQDAVIVNETKGRLTLEGPVLRLVLEPGERRIVRAPLNHRNFTRTFHGDAPGGFEVVQMDPVRVLRDMVAERQRAIEMNNDLNADHLTVGALLERSALKVFPLRGSEQVH